MNHVWDEVDCPTCGQLAGQRCRTLSTGRVTDTHAARHSESFDNMIADLHEMSRNLERGVPRDRTVRTVHLPGDG